MVSIQLFLNTLVESKYLFMTICPKKQIPYDLKTYGFYCTFWSYFERAKLLFNDNIPCYGDLTYGFYCTFLS